MLSKEEIMQQQSIIQIYSFMAGLKAMNNLYKLQVSLIQVKNNVKFFEYFQNWMK